MPRLQLNKSSLAKEQKNLETFKRFLPSLDLKRQQLMLERNKARQAVKVSKDDIEALSLFVGDTVPMLANDDVDLDGLVTLKGASIGQENVVGIHLPTLENVETHEKYYSPLVTPHWVDTIAALLKKMLHKQIELRVNQRRLALLDDAVRTITQRVNLFEKVLIPQTLTNIKRIKIYLSDEQMAAVVRSKIAKRKRHAEVNV